VPKLPVLVNGAAGVIAMVGGQPFAVMGFTVAHGKVVEINAILGPERLARLDLSFLNGGQADETPGQSE
jgi:RNA polymerase sigma-70 factor (ECF subfamily)